MLTIDINTGQDWVRPRGLWSLGEDYLKNDMAANDNDLFICLVDNTGATANEPGTGAQWQTYWIRMVDMLTAAQIAACAGTAGTPGSDNKFVTNSDTRLTDTRTPPDDSVTLAKLAHGTSQGSILAYQGSGKTPTELTHGSTGQYLMTQGLNADVAWSSIAWSDVSKTNSNISDLASHSHTSLTDIGTNTHSAIDTALARLAGTSGSNTGDQTIPSLSDLGGVPTSRKVAGHALSGDVTVDHGDLTSIGTNSHSTIDTFISSKAAASGLATLDASSKLVQANAVDSVTLDMLVDGTRGSVLICTADGEWTELGYGTDGYLLATQGINKDPHWIAPYSYTLSIPEDFVSRTMMADGTQGSVLIVTTDGEVTDLGYGTDGQYLKTQGVGKDAIWAGITWSQVDKTGSNLTDLATKSHTVLTDIGTNSHTTIDTFISSKAAASGLASLDTSSQLVQVNAPDSITLAMMADLSQGSIVKISTDGEWVELTYGSAGQYLRAGGQNADAAWGSIAWSEVSKTNSNVSDLASHSHTALTDIGTNAHTAIDTFISSKAAASGLASLDASSQLVQVNAPDSVTLAMQADLTQGSVLKITTDGEWAELTYGSAGQYLRAGGQNTDVAWSSIVWSEVSKSGSNLTDIATRSHTALSDIGTNTHATIDTHITNNNLGTEYDAHATNASVTQAQCQGTIWTNVNQSGAVTQTLPTSVAGLTFNVSLAANAAAFNVKPYSGQKINLNGTLLAADHKVAVTPAAGNSASFWTYKLSDGTYAWWCLPINGTWSDGGT